MCAACRVLGSAASHITRYHVLVLDGALREEVHVTPSAWRTCRCPMPIFHPLSETLALQSVHASGHKRSSRYYVRFGAISTSMQMASCGVTCV